MWLVGSRPVCGLASKVSELCAIHASKGRRNTFHPDPLIEIQNWFWLFSTGLLRIADSRPSLVGSISHPQTPRTGTGTVSPTVGLALLSSRRWRRGHDGHDGHHGHHGHDGHDGHDGHGLITTCAGVLRE